MELKEEYGYTLEEAIKLDKGKLLEIFGIKKDGRRKLINQLLELVNLKECSKCGEHLPMSEFYGKSCVCRECYNAPKEVEAKLDKDFLKDNQEWLIKNADSFLLNNISSLSKKVLRDISTYALKHSETFIEDNKTWFDSYELGAMQESSKFIESNKSWFIENAKEISFFLVFNLEDEARQAWLDDIEGDLEYKKDVDETERKNKAGVW